MNWFGSILVLAGLFSMAAAVFNGDWFMNSRRVRFFVSIIGRTGTRILYGVTGVILTMLGILGLLGVIELV